MSNNISRRSFIKKTIGSLMTIIGASYGGYFYAHRIEPRLLKTESHIVEHPSIPKGFDGFKIVQFSDTHLGFQYSLPQFKEMLSQIEALHPDLIIFTGDLLDAPNEYQDKEAIIPLLNKLKAPFGKFSIYGNHDHGGYGSNIYKNIMELSGFNLLVNSSQVIRLLDGNSIYIAGLDDAMLGIPDIDSALKNVPNSAYKIMLSHAPDIADSVANYGVQLQISGHSHGGQIQIPFVGALITPPYAKNYTEGFYQITGQNNKMDLYVNRGIGTTRLPFRFLSKPEITVFTLKSSTP